MDPLRTAPIKVVLRRLTSAAGLMVSLHSEKHSPFSHLPHHAMSPVLAQSSSRPSCLPSFYRNLFSPSFFSPTKSEINLLLNFPGRFPFNLAAALGPLGKKKFRDPLPAPTTEVFGNHVSPSLLLFTSSLRSRFNKCVFFGGLHGGFLNGWSPDSNSASEYFFRESSRSLSCRAFNYFLGPLPSGIKRFVEPLNLFGGRSPRPNSFGAAPSASI